MEIKKEYVICNEWHQRVSPVIGGYQTREIAEKALAQLSIANALHIVEKQTPAAVSPMGFARIGNGLYARTRRR